MLSTPNYLLHILLQTVSKAGESIDDFLDGFPTVSTDLASDTLSWHELDFLHPNRSRENFVAQMAMYVPNPNEREQPYASPLRALDVSGFPPALVITAEFDPQQDEGGAYAQRLRDAGCLVTHTRYPGVLHGFFQMGGVIASGMAITEVAAYLRLRFSLVS
jgi:acetyl esterase